MGVKTGVTLTIFNAICDLFVILNGAIKTKLQVCCISGKM